MLNHALVTAPLFFIVATLAMRAGGSELLRDMGGVAFRAPVLAGLFLIVTLATLAMPGSANFIGEFNILLGVFQSKLVIAIIAFTGVVGAAFYALRMFISSMHNRVGRLVGSRELHLVDAVPIAGIVLVILALAFYPQFGLRRSQPTVRTVVAPVAVLSQNPYSKLAAQRSVIYP
jgi:NADH-quinone oxidoreductase subunit M